MNDPIHGANAALPASYDTSSRGWLGGGQVGCNWQANQWVFGIEGDVDAVNLKSSTDVLGVAVAPSTQAGPGFGLAPPSTFTANEQVQQRWLSTVRGRVGFAIAEKLLLFGTGGLAIGDVATMGSVTASNAPAGGSTVIVWSGSSSATKVGYSVGGGAEYAFADHWSVKGEYIYYDLGTVSHPLGLTSNSNGLLTPFSTLGNTTTRVNGNIVRLGLNYKF